MLGLIILIVVVVGGVFWLLIGPYNALVRLRNTIQESWRQVDVELNRRYDLIPNLVETVQGYAIHERETLADVVALRNQARQLDQGAQGASTPERAAIEGRLSGAVNQLLAIGEAYPALKADAGFRQLADQLAATEDRIANARRYYNAVVGDYNTKVDSFPSTMVARMFNFTKAGYFQIEEATMREAPRIDLTNPPRPPTQMDARSGAGSGTSAVTGGSQTAAPLNPSQPVNPPQPGTEPDVGPGVPN